MKFLCLVAFSFVSSAAFACPNLAGKWLCKEAGRKSTDVPQTSIVDVKQADVAGIGVYALGSLETVGGQESDDQSAARSFTTDPDKTINLQLIVADGRENVTHDKEDNVVTKYQAACNGDSVVISASFNRQIDPSKVTDQYRGKSVSLQGRSQVVVSTDGKVLNNDLTITTEVHVDGTKIKEETSTSHRNCDRIQE
jgi:hypothetical protein